MPDRILFDLNVMLDVLLERAPHVIDSAPLVDRVAKGEFIGVLSGASIDTMAYLMSGVHTPARINGIIRFVRLKFDIAPISQAIIDQALSAGWDDLEDAIVYYSGLAAGCTTLVTRNVKDFRKGIDSNLRVCTPREFRSPGAGAPSSR
jgi:predicted nucleic acid-binding protein